MAYLRVIVNPLDQEALLRIINTPRRGISEQTLDHLTSINRKNGIPLWEVLNNCENLPERSLKSIKSFISLIKEAKEKLSTGPLHLSFQWLIETINYKNTITDDVKSDKMRSFKWERVLECIETLKVYEETEQEEAPSLAHFLSTTLLARENTFHREKDFREDRVSLMTFHGAKGLEFPACFLVGLEDHLIPHEKTINVEEERRLLYVAMTRAMRFLTLSMAKKRNRFGKETSSAPSRFLFEISKELLKITAWNDYHP
jgi:DNA helicase-2/ATP-dependent DNA helicase PcrA